ncbi:MULTISPECIES: group II intron maturase-specific domain-containing protein [unclassified Streptomyces]|uniref:Group II intron maturase-specific domain-containing protein n=1 Tax=Streptomyces sp. NBC_00180 TaxID=2903632 RepID=A0AAU1IBF4_9ACTN|nr:hypothetical protein OG331_03120 [Streptomyces sp. NBC_01017]WSV34930.1 hypothetical protein OG331_48855 [Streptomyces sp. NBC_01017]
MPTYNLGRYGGRLQDANRRASYEHTEFTFLGLTFRTRSAVRRDGQMFRAFLPAINGEALRRISSEVRSWRLHHRTNLTEADLARFINPIIRGWRTTGPSTRRPSIPFWNASTPT